MFHVILVCVGAALGMIASPYVTSVLCDSTFGWPSAFYLFGNIYTHVHTHAHIHTYIHITEILVAFLLLNNSTIKSKSAYTPRHLRY